MPETKVGAEKELEFNKKYSKKMHPISGSFIGMPAGGKIGTPISSVLVTRTLLIDAPSYFSIILPDWVLKKDKLLN